MNIYDLDVPTAASVWKALAPLYGPALRYHPHMDVVDLFHLVATGRVQCVVVVDEGDIQGGAVMEIVEYPSSRVGNVFIVGGKRGFLRRYMRPLMEHLIQWSIHNGCDTITGTGRAGWARWMPKHFEDTRVLDPITQYVIPLRPVVRTH